MRSLLSDAQDSGIQEKGRIRVGEFGWLMWGLGISYKC